MKIFIFTYDRYDTITTSKYFKEFDHIVLCHDDYMKGKYLESGRVYGDLIATKEQKGLANNRNYALSLMEKGEWALFFVDDLINIYEYEHYDTADYEVIPKSIDPNNAFKKTIDSNKFLKRCKKEIKRCEDKNIFLSGFAAYENGYFLTKKYKYYALVDGRCWLIKKMDLKFDLNTQLIDDMSFTAMNLKNYGRGNINQWIIPKCKRYTKGAYGTMDERMNQKIKECKYLVETYPDIIRYADKPKWPSGSHVKIRYKKSTNQITLF